MSPQDVSLLPLHCLPIAPKLVPDAGQRVGSATPVACQGGQILAPAGTYNRSAPVLLDDADTAAKTRDTLEPVRSAQPQSYSAHWAFALPGARIAGQGAVVTQTGDLIAESVVQFTANGRVPEGLTDVGGCYAIAAPDHWVEQPCLLAKRPWYRNYGHWLVDCATIIALAADHGATDMAIVVGEYDHPTMSAVVHDTIKLLAPTRAILHHPDHEVWGFDLLQYVAPLHVPPFFKHPAALRRLRDRLLASVPRRTPNRRLFVSRGDRGSRLLLNENELLGFCVKQGFELVHPERLSLTEQVRLFSEADVVIGVKGAALTNALFMSAGAAMLVLSPADFPDPFFWDICGQLDIGYAELFGPITTTRAAGQNDFTVHLGKLRAALSQMIRVG